MWLTWEQAWRAALYAPGTGLFRRDAPATHFATAAQGIPYTTTLLAEAFASLARRENLGHVVEIGAGRGELATALATVATDLEVTAVDVVPRPVGLPARVRWRVAAAAPEDVAPEAVAPDDDRMSGPDDEAEEDLDVRADCLVIAVEWLDAIPCPVLEIDDDGRPRTVLVHVETGAERLGPAAPAADLDWCERWWPLDDLTPGCRIEVGRPRAEAWSRLLARMRGGLAVAVDYGHVRSTRPRYGTLAAYRRGRVARAVPDGTRDLTAHVAVDALPHESLQTQRTSLTALGVMGAAPDPARAARDPLGYARELSRAGAAARLLDPGGLGGFSWVRSRPTDRPPAPATRPGPGPAHGPAT